MRNIRTRQRGLSLVELMVALLIGVILTSGVISVYITSKTSYTMNMGLGQVQEAGRFALTTLQPILTMSGNMGCRHPTPSELLPWQINVASTDDVYNFKDAVYGYDYTGTGTGDYHPDGGASNNPTVDNTAGHWSPNLSTDVAAALNGYAVQYSDVLMVHEMLSNPANVIQATTTSANIAYQATDAPAMVAGQLLLASDCNRQWSEFIAGTVSAHNVNTAGTGNNALPMKNYSAYPAASVGPAQTYVFFVGKSGIDNGTSLFESHLGTDAQLSAPVEIVPGVENMQVLYGEDTTPNPQPDGSEVLTPDTYETADNVTDWTRVVSVRVALIVHSDPNAVDKAPATTTAFHMLGTDYTDSFNYVPTADRRMRRYFAETFSLRNSLP